MGEVSTLMPMGEDKLGGVRDLIAAILESRFKDIVSCARSSLKSYNLLGGGIVTSSSVPDLVWLARNRLMGVFEVKGGEASALVALRQAAVTGVSIATDLLARGLFADQVVVPLAGCNGLTMQFGALFVLEPSFPTFVATSRILDLGDEKDNLIAAAYVRKASLWVIRMDELLRQCEMSPSTKGGPKKAQVGGEGPVEQVQQSSSLIELDLNSYWTKELTEENFDRGIGLFASTSSATTSNLDVWAGLDHMGRALTLLFNSEATRGIPVYPLSVRSPTYSEGDSRVNRRVASDWCFLLVYQDLSKLGFKIGAPNRLEDEILYQLFVAALRRAVQLIHAAGVLHTDLYPSNIMWREEGVEEPPDLHSGGGDDVGDVRVALSSITLESTFCDGIGSSSSSDSSNISSKNNITESKEEGKTRRVVIRIIDWDCAHCLSEGDFSGRISAALTSHLPARSCTFSEEQDLRYLRVFEKERPSDGCEDALWTAIGGGGKIEMDKAFYLMFVAVD